MKEKIAVVFVTVFKPFCYRYMTREREDKRDCDYLYHPLLLSTLDFFLLFILATMERKTRVLLFATIDIIKLYIYILLFKLFYKNTNLTIK